MGDAIRSVGASIPHSKIFLHVVGNGQRVKFLNDPWCEETPRSVSFPFLNCYCSVNGGLGSRLLGWVKKGKVDAKSIY